MCYLMVLFQIIGDLFRDRELSGWWKALWVIFLIIFPFLAAVIYLIARGRGMAERQAGEMRKLKSPPTNTSNPSRARATRLTRSHRRRACWTAAPLPRRSLTSSSRKRLPPEFLNLNLNGRRLDSTAVLVASRAVPRLSLWTTAILDVPACK